MTQHHHEFSITLKICICPICNAYPYCNSLQDKAQNHLLCTDTRSHYSDNMAIIFVSLTNYSELTILPWVLSQIHKVLLGKHSPEVTDPELKRKKTYFTIQTVVSRLNFISRSVQALWLRAGATNTTGQISPTQKSWKYSSCLCFAGGCIQKQCLRNAPITAEVNAWTWVRHDINLQIMD